MLKKYESGVVRVPGGEVELGAVAQEPGAVEALGARRR